MSDLCSLCFNTFTEENPDYNGQHVRNCPKCKGCGLSKCPNETDGYTRQLNEHGYHPRCQPCKGCKMSFASKALIDSYHEECAKCDKCNRKGYVQRFCSHCN